MLGRTSYVKTLKFKILSLRKFLGKEFDRCKIIDANVEIDSI